MATKGAAHTELLPGKALVSGFTFRPVADYPWAQLSETARERIAQKMESVDRARLRAAETSSQRYIG
jgi:hypothetical protein